MSLTPNIFDLAVIERAVTAIDRKLERKLTEIQEDLETILERVSEGNDDEDQA